MIKTFAAPLSVIIMLSIKQVLFKTIGGRIGRLRDFLEPQNILILVAALAIYGVATIVWIYVLSYMSLSRAFTFYALIFVIIPILSALIFGERIGHWQIGGAALIVAGVLLSLRT